MENKQSQESLLTRAVIVGFVGGLGSSIFSIAINLFNFSQVALKSYLFIPIIHKKWPNIWVSHLSSIIIAAAISVLIALVYYALLRRLNSIWIGMLYGVILWLIVFLLVMPLYPNGDDIKSLNKDTIVSTICIFVLYGTFIGYSISHDYFDRIVRE